MSARQFRFHSEPLNAEGSFEWKLAKEKKEKKKKKKTTKVSFAYVSTLRRTQRPGAKEPTSYSYLTTAATTDWRALRRYTYTCADE